MIKITAVLVAAGASALAIAPVHAIVPTELPPRSITHQNSQYWSWAGPRNWTSADGAYGIFIQSGNGQLSLDYGFSSVLCATGADAAASTRAYFAQQRTALRQSLQGSWRRVRLDTSRIRQLPQGDYGPLYFRQSLVATGRAGGQQVVARVTFDYSLASGPTYCYARSISKVAPAAGVQRSMRWLGSVQDSLAYFGPGVPPGPDD
jgi:hypothetical protein